MNTQRLTYTVHARVIAPGVSRGEVAGKTEPIGFDTSAGQSDTLPGPADLLVTAFAACALKNVERMSRLLPFRYDGAEIEVTAERETNPPRIAQIRYRLRVVTDEPEHRVSLLHRNIARQGTIYNTLAQCCDVEGELITSPGGYRSMLGAAAPVADDGEGCT